MSPTHEGGDDAEVGEEIPAFLHSAYEEGPFRRCSVCEGDLFEKGTLYEIQKVLRGTDVVFEYAICRACGAKLLESYSEESIGVIQAFFEKRFQPTGEMTACHFCRREDESGRRDVSLIALCMGPRLLAPPVVMCDDCTEALNEKLSKKTRDAYGDFIDTHFPGVPAEWDVPVTALGV